MQTILLTYANDLQKTKKCSFEKKKYFVLTVVIKKISNEEVRLKCEKRKFEILQESMIMIFLPIPSDIKKNIVYFPY